MRLGFRLLAPALIGTALAQDVPPAHKPADQPLSLDATMKFLQDKLAGKVSYTIQTHDNVAGTDSTDNQSVETTNVFADAGNCQIEYRRRAVIDTKASPDQDFGLRVNRVRAIEVMPMGEWMKQIWTGRGHPEWSFKTDPPVFALVVRRAGGQPSHFGFDDEALAHTVAKALQRAADLCEEPKKGVVLVWVRP